MALNKKEKSKLQIHQKYNRTFSDAFRREKVSDLDNGILTISELCNRYQISRTTVYRWLYKYSVHHQSGTKQVVQMQSEEHKTKTLQIRVSELEQIIGQKQLALDYLEELIRLASEDLGYDLKKNIEQKRLKTSVLSPPNATK